MNLADKYELTQMKELCLPFFVKKVIFVFFNIIFHHYLVQNRFFNIFSLLQAFCMHLTISLTKLKVSSNLIFNCLLDLESPWNDGKFNFFNYLYVQCFFTLIKVTFFQNTEILKFFDLPPFFAQVHIFSENFSFGRKWTVKFKSSFMEKVLRIWPAP